MITYCLDARTVTDHFPGIGRYTVNLARAMQPALTEDERLILLRNPDVNSPWTLEAAAGPRTDIVDIPLSPFSLRQQWAIPRRLRGLNVSLYHSPYYLMPYAPRMPALVTVHDLIPLLYPRYFSLRQRLIFAVTMGLAIRRSRQVIAVSQATANDLVHLLGISPEAIVIIPEAADPVFAPQPAVEIERIQQNYTLPDGYVLYFGSNKPHKNLVRLIRAWEKLQPQPMPLVIAGVWDERYPTAKQEIMSRKIEDSVRFLGPIPDDAVPALFAGATVFVFPSEYEGFGLPVLEAMACGTPVACSDTSSLPNVAGDAARLFDPTDIDAIADALGELLADATLRSRLRDRGFARASAFSWNRAAETTCTLYRATTS